MRLTVLFWNFNIGKGDLMEREPNDAAKAALLARVAQANGVDVLSICDCALGGDEILTALRVADGRYDQPANPHPRIKFFSRFPGQELEPWRSDGRLAIRRLARRGHKDILLAGFHFIDRRHNSPEKQHAEIDTYRQTLIEAESAAGHSRTALFGDFNLNPFEIAMLDPKAGLGAMMNWELAISHCEAGQGGPSRFYNPMWSVMGKAEAPGTHYYDGSDPKNPYWHCIDGVLLRPALREIFVEGSVRILSRIPASDGAEILLYRLAEKHYHLAYSDHLPLVFEIDVPELQET
jgi:hypothetical protein